MTQLLDEIVMGYNSDSTTLKGGRNINEVR